MTSLLLRAQRLLKRRSIARPIATKLDVHVVDDFGSRKRFYSGSGAEQDDGFIFPEYESEPSELSFWEIYGYTNKSCNIFQRLLTTMLLRSIQQGSIFYHKYRDNQFNSEAEFVMYNWSINNFINDSADAVQTCLESMHPYKDPNNSHMEIALAKMTMTDLTIEPEGDVVATPLESIHGLMLNVFDHFHMQRYFEDLLTWDELSERMPTDFDVDDLSLLNRMRLAYKRNYEENAYGQNAYWELIGTKGIVSVEYFPSAYQVYQRAHPRQIEASINAKYMEMLKHEAIKGMKNQETYVAINVLYNLSLVHPDNDEESTNHDVSVLWFGALQAKKKHGQWQIARLDFHNLTSQTHHFTTPFDHLYPQLMETQA